MSWKTFIGCAWTLLSLLAMTCGLVACQSIQTTLTGATDAAKAERSNAVDVCRAWKDVTYSSRDTNRTQDEVRANNASRDAYCGAP